MMNFIGDHQEQYKPIPWFLILDEIKFPLKFLIIFQI